jgi:hypothetical protein
MNQITLRFFLILLFAFLVRETAADELSIKQKILMPGELIEGHAKWETQCETCHSNFSKKEMTKLCLDCHKDIAKDRISKTGFHGQDKLAANNSCNSCHKDHQGRKANILGNLPDNFDHNSTRFALLGVHQTTNCNSCHQDNKPFRDTESSCVSCHLENDVHKNALGNQCESCHQPEQWKKLLPFDHSKTDFALKGAHMQTNCNSCHIGQQFSITDTSCVSCHKAADVHAGTNGNQCSNCHNEQSWKKVNFDHDKTDFPLKGSHLEVSCQACHKNENDTKKLPLTCNGCHANSDVHLGRNGTECDTCHNNQKWDQVKFNHNKDTDFQLTGHHQNLECSQCHTGALKDPIARDCASCHLADDIHKNDNMKVCSLCHTTENWKTTSQFDHDFTDFPLLGMHQIAACETCHVNSQFSAIDRSCGSCHLDAHEGALGTECSQCHNPNAWNIWHFDHDTQTQFELDGKHKNLECNSCHIPGSKPTATPTSCGSCHKNQDIHNGEFGSQCGQCHNTSNFFELFIQ